MATANAAAAAGAGSHSEGKSSSRWRTVSYDVEHDIKLDYLSPPEGKHKAPFFFYVHGGSFVAGNRWSVGTWPVAIALERGWGLITVDYRLVPESSAAEGVADVLRAWQFVTSGKLDTDSSSLDPSRGIALGSSAGCHAARSIAAALNPSLPPPVALVELYPAPSLDSDVYDKPFPYPVPPHPLLTPELHPAVHMLLNPTATTPPFFGSLLDLVSMHGLPAETVKERAIANGFTEDEVAQLQVTRPLSEADHVRSALSLHVLVAGTLGKYLSGPKNDADWERYPRNPAKVACAKDPKSWPLTLVVHGDADFIVPIALSEAYVDQLKAAGVTEARLVKVPGGLHGFDVLCDTQSPPVREVVAFLDGIAPLSTASS